MRENKASDEPIKALEKMILLAISQASSLEDLNQVRIDSLGRRGSITKLMKSLCSFPMEIRRKQGSLYNSVRLNIEEAIAESKTYLANTLIEEELASNRVDMTLPSRPFRVGVVHPLSQTLFEVVSALHCMGFSIARGPEIESDFNNFFALNIPPNHPARHEQDTFYMPNCPNSNESRVLRTHTSPVQIRVMLKQKPPLRIMAFGRVYRSDHDRMHTPCFHQVEGLFIDKGVHMGHLKQCLFELCSRLFQNDLPAIRFRPSFFPFTSPSAEIDINCSQHKQGPRSSGSGGNPSQQWVEVLGCGMVHPKVLESCSIDPEIYQGFAFGIGVERISMLKYGIRDSRQFYEGDIRWITHYGISPALAFL